ncbi:calcium-activated chloride channel regulator 4-like [Ornithodoros turicata]|uniref:calcium-activated chloride channel regulator 4-like n=1 Tax=Ornithodoros turicata TaxID=34597 RepID=UPI00313A0465
MELNQRLEMTHRAVARYIQDWIPDGMELGVVSFNTDATINAELTEVNRTTRAGLRAKLPRGYHGSTSIGNALQVGVQVLEQNATSIVNSVIIILLDGRENTRPYIKDVSPELFRKGVIVHTLALGTSADEGLEGMALATGGNSYAVTNEKMLVLENLEKAFFSASMAQLPIVRKPVTLVNKVIPLEGNTTSLFVTVDRELGKNLEFLASGGDGATTTVTVNSPSGNTYVGEYDEDLKRHKVSIGDIVEPGKWQVDIKRDNPPWKQSSVSITVVSEAKDPHDPPVRMRTFYSTKYLSYARASSQFKILVELTKGEQVVRGAYVVAKVTTPVDNQVPVFLKDNGAGADIIEGDGIYSGFFIVFSKPGRYSVEVRAYGDENTNLITPKRSARPVSGGHKVRRSAEPFAFERYENAGIFVVKKVGAALIYPPSTIQDLRVTQALYLDNGTRMVSLKWTSPGAHLDQGICHSLTVIASRNRTVLQTEDMTGDFYKVIEYDVVNGTLRPQQSRKPHEVTFLIPDTWLPPNKSAHDVYFTVRTWNSDGIKSDRSNIAAANFFEQSEMVVGAAPSTIRDLRVEQALYLDNGTRAVSLTWTSPGARLDEGTCHNLTIIASCDRTVLQTGDMTGDFYTVTEYDVLNGTLCPQHFGEPHEVTFFIPDTWCSPNKSAHDVYFTVSTWNSDGIKSNRSNIATANFFEQSEMAVGAAPSTIRDLRVEQALYLNNGTRAVSLTWTSPGARLDEGTCHNLTIIASCDRTVLQTDDVTGDFYTVTEYDVLNGTLRPQHFGEPHEVTFFIPDTWCSPNKSAHDVYFTVSTWNSDGIKSNRSNIATANFLEEFQLDVKEKELTIWEKLLASRAVLYVGSALLGGVLLTVLVILVINIFVKKSPSSKSVERVAQTARAKYEVEMAFRENLVNAS